MRDKLHSEIDLAEKLQNRAVELVQKIVAAKLGAALSLGRAGKKKDAAHVLSHVTEGLQLLAGTVARAMNALTTEAVRLGYKTGRERYK